MSNRSKRVLVVEDSDDDFLLLSLAFRSAGLAHTIDRVKDGETAIQYLGRQGKFADGAAHPAPDLLLMDLKMPGMSGFDVLQFLAQHPEVQRPLVLVMSGSIMSKDEARSLELGARGYVSKPEDINGYLDLARRIDREFLS